MDEPVAVRNIKLVVAYDGTAYHGWQRQPGLATVQEAIEHAVVRVVGHPLAVNGAGRTDAGVHAAGQVANFRTTNLSIPVEKIARAVNSRCPPDVAIVSAAEVAPEFHASISAIGKTYRYRIYVGPAKPVMRFNHVYRFPPELDVERMAAAGRRLLGEHDFKGFAASTDGRATTVRTVTACQVSVAGDEIHVHVTGGGFLHKMVRNIVGTLLEVGRGHWAQERIDEVLATGDRSRAGPTAPANGLCLLHVFYPLNLTPTGM